MTDNTEVKLRSYTVNDKPLIYSSFLNSYIRPVLDGWGDLNLPDMIKNISWGVFFEYYSRELDNILADPDTEVIIACWAKKPDEVFGYVISKRPGSLYYIYIKKPYYNKGIEKLLLMSQYDTSPYIKYASPGCVRAVKSVYKDAR